MKLSALSLGLTLLIATAASGDADAQDRRSSSARSTFRQPALGVHPVGAYGGVHPGVKRSKAYKDRKRVKNRARRKNIVRWIGFQPRSAGSRVFVQLTGELEFSQSVRGSELIVTLAGARLGGRNARRPLDTRYFETVVRRAVAKRVRRRVELRIAFKNPSDAREASASMEKNDSDGFTYLFLDFAGTSSSAEDDDDGDDEIEISDDDE